MMEDFGLGDALLSYYKGTNGAYNLKHRYKGVKKDFILHKNHYSYLKN